MLLINFIRDRMNFREQNLQIILYFDGTILKTKLNDAYFKGSKEVHVVINFTVQTSV